MEKVAISFLVEIAQRFRVGVISLATKILSNSQVYFAVLSIK